MGCSLRVFLTHPKLWGIAELKAALPLDALALILEPQGEHLLFDNVVILRRPPEAPLRADDALMGFTERTWAKRHAAETKMAQ